MAIQIYQIILFTTLVIIFQAVPCFSTPLHSRISSVVAPARKVLPRWNSLNPFPSIIGGSPAGRGKWPWVVAIDTQNFSFVCGGSLIAPEWVLTAAHCVNGAPVQLFVRLAAYNLTANDWQERISVASIITHELYNNSEQGEYDVALLRLSSPASLDGENVSTIRLPPNDYDAMHRKNCWIVGWGKTDGSSSAPISQVLMERPVEVISNVECQRHWDRSIFAQPTIFPQNVCPDKANDTSACQGDSGSPMHCIGTNSAHWVAVGVASWGSSSCRGYPSVYMRVSWFREWIEEHTAQNSTTQHFVDTRQS